MKKGILTFPNGGHYVGELKDNKPHGQGTKTEIDADYAAAWVDDMNNIEKTPTQFPGKQYVGQWKDGLQHGQGTLLDIEENYVGEWKNGCQDGEGTYTYFPGSPLAKYVGQWKDGKEHGQGTYTLSDGSKITGEFKEGDLTDKALVEKLAKYYDEYEKKRHLN